VVVVDIASSTVVLPTSRSYLEEQALRALLTLFDLPSSHNFDRFHDNCINFARHHWIPDLKARVKFSTQSGPITCCTLLLTSAKLSVMPLSSKPSQLNSATALLSVTLSRASPSVVGRPGISLFSFHLSHASTHPFPLLHRFFPK
jgi:hypothetical protein